MKIKDIIEKVEKTAPKELACSWDNTGLLVGNDEWETDIVLLALDVNEDAAKEAIKIGAKLILSHHPFVFSGVKSFLSDVSFTKALKILIENDIAVYCAHTNLDSARGGLCDFLGEKLGFLNMSVLDEKENLGRICEISPISAKDLAEHIKKTLKIEALKLSNPEKIVKKVAFCTGSGSDFAKTAFLKGADAYFCGDVKYSVWQEFACEDFSIIDAGHYETEVIACELFEKILGGAVKTKRFTKRPYLFV